MDKIILEAIDISKSYANGSEKLNVLKNFSIKVNKGEVISIVGESGCGKSTLLRMIAGLEEVNSGTISINDKQVNDLSPKDRNIAMVFQSYALYPSMTVK